MSSPSHFCWFDQPLTSHRPAIFICSITCWRSVRSKIFSVCGMGVGTRSCTKHLGIPGERDLLCGVGGNTPRVLVAPLPENYAGIMPGVHSLNTLNCIKVLTASCQLVCFLCSLFITHHAPHISAIGQFSDCIMGMQLVLIDDFVS